MGKTWTRERERERIELGRERKRKMLLRRMNKKSILFLQVSYSTIINLGWYCNSIVNFFTTTILGNASFQQFDAKIQHIQSFTTPIVMPLDDQINQQKFNNFCTRDSNMRYTYIYIYIYIPNLGWWIYGSTSNYATTILAVVCLSLLQVSESHSVTLFSFLSISHLGFLFFGVLHIVVFSILTSFYFLFLFFMNKKQIGDDMNWRLPPRRVHSDTLPTGPRSAKAGDLDDFLFFFFFFFWVPCVSLFCVVSWA